MPDKCVFNGLGISGIVHPGTVADHDMKTGINEFQPNTVKPELFLGNNLKYKELHECDREK
jgi:hypothetical protein